MSAFVNSGFASPLVSASASTNVSSASIRASSFSYSFSMVEHLPAPTPSHPAN